MSLAGKDIAEVSDDMNFFDYMAVLKRYKLLFITLSTGLLISVMVFVSLLPDIYTSTVSIFVPVSNKLKSNIVIDAAERKDLDIFHPLLIKKDKDILSIWLGILKSNRLKSSVITELNLYEHYGKESTEDILKILNNNVKIFMSNRSIIYVTATDENPEFAADLANKYIDELKLIYDEIYITSSNVAEQYLSKRLSEISANINQMNRELADNKLKPAGTVKRDMLLLQNRLAELESELLSREFELELLYITHENSDLNIIRKKYQINSIQEKIDSVKLYIVEVELAHTNQNDDSAETVLYGDSRVNLLTEYSVNRYLYKILRQMYEIVKVNKLLEKPEVHYLESAVPNKKPAKPKKKQIFVTLSIISILFSGILTFFVNYININK